MQDSIEWVSQNSCVKSLGINFYLFLPTHLSTILLRKHGLISKSTSKRYFQVTILFLRCFCLVLVSIDYVENNLKQVHPIFQTVFKTFLKDKEKIINALQLLYSNAKLEATNNLIKLIKRNAFGFRNFENFKKRIFIALNIKKERTKFVLSRAQLFFNPLQLTKSQISQQESLLGDFLMRGTCLILNENQRANQEASLRLLKAQL